MSKWKVTLIAGFSILIVVSIIILVGGKLGVMESLSPFSPRCDGDLKVVVASKSGKYVAGGFVSSCGATTSYYSHINIRKNNEEFVKDKWGRYEKGRVCVVDGNYIPVIKWSSDQLIIAEYPKSDNGKIIADTNIYNIKIKCKIAR